jgi:hypothetical protein
MRMRYLAFVLSLLICLFTAWGIGPKDRGARAFAEDTPKEKEISPSPSEKAKAKRPAASKRQREPFHITPELEAQREEVEPPEIKVTGVVQVKGKAMALVDLELEDYDGTTVLEPGMRVSMPKPNTGESESKKWMTYFVVKRVSRTGMVVVLENGETVWYPVMGEMD